MSNESPHAKRIKRHIIGRRRTYFAAALPGFEDLCYNELAALGLPIESISIVDGGVEFTGKLVDCYQANLQLRTASRILLRIDCIKATGFRQLEKKAAQIPWELYLPASGIADMHVTARHCRLYHTEAVGQCILSAIERRLTDNGLHRAESTTTRKAAGLYFRPEAGKTKARPCFNRCGCNRVPSPAMAGFENNQSGESRSDITVFVRGLDDWFTISVDSSGEHLHRRGLKRHHGRAPLRETLAAAALLLADYKPPEPLMDPMCGTGTFSLEAAMMAKNIPPGWFREFAFRRWPSFSQKRWSYLKRQCETLFNRLQQPIIFASDRDSAACQRLETCIKQNRLSDVITVSKKNFFDFRPEEVTDQTGVVVINPPYGVRLGSRDESETLWDTIVDYLNRAYKGWKVVLIAPDQKLVEKVSIELDVRPFFHGGLKPALMFGRIT